MNLEMPKFSSFVLLSYMKSLSRCVLISDIWKKKIVMKRDIAIKVFLKEPLLPKSMISFLYFFLFL